VWASIVFQTHMTSSSVLEFTQGLSYRINVQRLLTIVTGVVIEFVSLYYRLSGYLMTLR